jgi:hypothetical protein
MTWTLDRTTDVGKVRVLITGESVEATAVFADEDIDVFLAIEDNVYGAAALGLERIAGDSALLLRKVRDTDPTADVLFGGAMRLSVGSIQLDATPNAKAYLDLAARYRAAAEGGAGAEDDILFASMVVDERTWAEHVVDDLLRSGD